MKILTIAGTRPELIRLSMIIKKLDKLTEHILVYSNQNYDPNLSTIFFDDLGIRKPNYYFEQQSSIGTFLGNSFIEFEKILKIESPDKILILGDTNTGLMSILSQKYDIPVYHMEAGNRCYDDSVPEEMNRKMIDHVSTYNLPYTDDSKNILLREGFNDNKIIKTGNPIFEVLNNYENKINDSEILSKMNLNNDFVLVTTHRSENVDDANTLFNIVDSLNEISKTVQVVFSVHPRTKSKLLGMGVSENILLCEPFGFFDFIKLEKFSKCIITDSGTVQEEGAIFGIPTLVIRNSTERRELIECGSTILCGTQKDNIISSYNLAIKKGNIQTILPNDYMKYNVSDTVINILMAK